MKPYACRILFLLLALTLLFSLTACAENEPTPPKLATPVVTLDGNVASWSPDPNAAKFELLINGTTYELPSTDASFTLEKGESLRVRAIGDGVTSTTGEWSTAVAYTPIEVYRIKWMHGTELLEVDEVMEGRVPAYDGVTPTEPECELFTYTFDGWSPSVSPARADTVYQASFAKTPKKVLEYDSGFDEKRIDASYEYRYDVIDLSSLSAYATPDYRFRFEVSVYMCEVSAGYQEIYLEDELAFKFGSIGSDFAHGGDGRDGWGWNSFTAERRGDKCDEKVYLRYGAHGKNSDDWIRGRAIVKVTVLYS